MKRDAITAYIHQLSALADATKPFHDKTDENDFCVIADWRRIELKLPDEFSVDPLLSQLDSQPAEEISRRFERLEHDWAAFLHHRRKWRDELQHPNDITGELSDPSAKFATFRRNLLNDLVYLRGLRDDNRHIGHDGGMSQTDFAALCGVTTRTVKNWESGKTNPPSVYDDDKKKEIKYSKELRIDPIRARVWANFYRIERERLQAIIKNDPLKRARNVKRDSDY